MIARLALRLAIGAQFAIARSTAAQDRGARLGAGAWLLFAEVTHWLAGLLAREVPPCAR